MDNNFLRFRVLINYHSINTTNVAFRLIAARPPRVEIYPEPAQRVSTGQSVLFQCRVVAGIPNPEVRWTRPGGSTQFERNVEIMEGGVIRY